MLFQKAFLIAVAFLISAPCAWAQPGDPGGDPDNPVPITGLAYLVAAGAILGIKKLRDLRKNKGS